jgi:hypothetical protein
MAVAEKKITLKEAEAYKGKIVRASQLSDILDTYIILTDVHLVKNEFGVGTFEGVLDTISKSEVKLTKPHSTLIYNDSYEQEGYCGYE